MGEENKTVAKVNIEQKHCPFCGQIVLAEEGVDPRRRCRCAEAVRYSAEQETLEDMIEQLKELFGPECNNTSPVFIPVDDNAFAILHNIVMVAAAGLFTKASITLEDGSVFTVKNDTVSRRVTVKM